MKLAGKVAIVTGSSRGIGKAIALAFAREGADIVVAARTEVAKAELPGTIGETVAAVKTLGRQALGVRCNVGEEEEVAQMVARAKEAFGRVDILVNNAAVGYYVPLMDTPPKHWDLVMRVNVKGTYLCCRAVVPLMAAQGGGSIINLSSPAADSVYSLIKREAGELQPSGIAYGASKIAIERISRGLAVEVSKHNIAVNALKPTVPTASEGLKFWNKGAEDDMIDPDIYMTKAALFLACQDGKGITGQVFDDQRLCQEQGLG